MSLRVLEKAGYVATGEMGEEGRDLCGVGDVFSCLSCLSRVPISQK